MSSVAQRSVRVTISLSQETLEIADRLAGERSTTRSGLVAQLLKKAEEERRRPPSQASWPVHPQGLVPQPRPNADESFRTILWDEPWG